MTYNVPTTLLVLASSCLLPKILAVPKSEIFAFISSSNKTLLAFKSLWMILRRESSWRYRIPLAIPRTMAARLSQSSSLHFVGSAREKFLFFWRKKNPTTILKVTEERQLTLKCYLTISFLRIGTRSNLNLIIDRFPGHPFYLFEGRAHLILS